MKWALPILLLAPLGAQPPFTILSVDRTGLPPYEPSSRIYRLDGGAERGLKQGAWLAIRRPGVVRPLGHLKVMTVGAREASTSFFPAGDAWPMKGDQVWPDPLPGLPGNAAMMAFPSTLPEPPSAGAVPPPMEGLLFFLPRRAELSPAGREKVMGWVKAWGARGTWVVQVPVGKALAPALQKHRAEALLAVLKECGVETAVVQQPERTHEGPYDPTWILHWD